jgi:uncharacterized repeat protein (TIGR01451 family)
MSPQYPTFTAHMTTGNGKHPSSGLSGLGRLLLSMLVTSSTLLPAAIAWADASSPPAGTLIRNQATGSFTSPNVGTQNIESNIVQVTVAEVTGITVVATGFTEAPNSVANAGPNQGDGTINTQDVVYFTFEITNLGNDPTQFFIPGSALITNGSASGPLQIISYDTNGSSVTLLSTPINIGTSGTTTGAALGLPLGSIAPGGKVTVRVPAKAATGLANNDVMTIVLGDTIVSNGSNQIYSDGGANRDLYTQDNQNGDVVNVPATLATETEAAGNPFNGDTTFSRREDSATQGIAIALVTVLPPSNPSVLLVKRITALNRGLANERLLGTSYVDVGASNDADNVVNWPGPATAATFGGGTVESYLAGISDGTASSTQVKPRDEIEYTISFLSDGDTAAGGMLVCDRVPSNTTFVSSAFNSSPPAGGGLGDRGILINFNNREAAFTNDNDGDEIANTSGNNGVGGYYFPAGVDPSTAFPGRTVSCGGTNTNGAIVVDLSDIPHATGEGTPISSYGFIRFRAAVN